MTASRIDPKTISATNWVDVQANWKGVDITEANGGLFQAPVSNLGGLLFVSWPMRFANLNGSGTSGVLLLKVPMLSYLPDQYCGHCTNNNGTARVDSIVALQAGGVFNATLVLISSTNVSLRAMIATRAMNY